MRLKKLQKELAPWVKYNFGDQPSYKPLLGMVEEVGELSHSHLKQEQKIRNNEDHEAKAKDALGDLLIYMADYANSRGWDLEEILKHTWSEVSKRDWVKERKTKILPQPCVMCDNPIEYCTCQYQ